MSEIKKGKKKKFVQAKVGKNLGGWHYSSPQIQNQTFCGQKLSESWQ